MLVRTVFSMVRNHICRPVTRSFTRPADGLHGLSLQVHKGNEETDETLDFLESTFAREEPIVNTFQIDDTCDLQRYLKHQLINGHVVKLVNEDCEILSAAVCCSTSPGSSDKTRTFADCNTCCPKTKRLLHFWADMSDSHNLYECFKVKGLWEISYLATSATGRNKGLGKVIVSESKLLGKKEGFSICRMDCTNHFTAKLAESLSFVTLPPRSCLTFRDKKGCPWLPRQPPHPHGNIVVSYDFLT
ncbi:uncharacterized protein LOC128987474 [Macrosteles quadrilineatus]|uniref:uncharacterized protein LOC128987474 n=1 Tax=Macrosteles quadrilineatus TaxID=74068 RepID=UPI0023E1A860|nr:uncharacterized protein LOC128987474 [Macrosteles quadrilineatus]